jgi:hypothetical protein
VSDANIKAAARVRDEMKCRDCGKTEKDHQEEYGYTLEVHRVFPGSGYHESLIVSLCHECHRRKPRNLADAYFDSFSDPESTDVAFVPLNLYLPDDRALWDCILAAAKDAELPPFVMARRMLEIGSRMSEQNYVI